MRPRLSISPTNPHPASSESAARATAAKPLSNFASVLRYLIPPEVTTEQSAVTYATEADLLNVALFGLTARQWRDANPALQGNMREYARFEQLLVLAKCHEIAVLYPSSRNPPAMKESLVEVLRVKVDSHLKKMEAAL